MGGDFKYNKITDTLSFTIRYEVVSVSKDTLFHSFISESTYAVRTSRQFVHTSMNVTLYSTTVTFCY